MQQMNRPAANTGPATYRLSESTSQAMANSARPSSGIKMLRMYQRG